MESNTRPKGDIEMTFLNVNDTNKLCGALDNCLGDVDLIAPDGAAYNWKAHGGAMRMLLTQVKVIDRLELRVHDARDRNRMMALMMQGRAS